MSASDHRGKKVLILGLGQYAEGSGASATRYFAKAGARVTVTDRKSRAELKEALRRLRGVRASYVLGGHRLGDVDRADIVVRNPGVPSDSPYLERARKRGVPILTDMVIFFRDAKIPIIGVTGTRGKSTTSTLIALMLKRSGRRAWLGGNIKVSPLNFLHKVKTGDLAVLELSSWMLESLGDERLSPEVAVFTNLMRDHLTTYPDMRAYARAKAAIFQNQGKGDTAVMSWDNAWTRRFGKSVPGNLVWTSLRPLKARDAVFIRSGKIVCREGGHESVVMPASSVALAGEHNLSNALEAAAAARVMGAGFKAIREVLKGFRGLSDRLETVRTVRGVRWVNDTTATTPDATIAAIRTLGPARRLVLIAGGTDKALDFRGLAKELRHPVKALVLLPGTATDKFRPLLGKKTAFPVSHAGSMREAVHAAALAAAKGDTVVLSPGAASFGLFRNEFDRGERFREALRALH